MSEATPEHTMYGPCMSVTRPKPHRVSPLGGGSKRQSPNATRTVRRTSVDIMNKGKERETNTIETDTAGTPMKEEDLMDQENYVVSVLSE